MAVSNLIGNKQPILPTKATKIILDTIYRHSAILMSDVGSILGSPINFPVPLLGFTYDNPQDMTVLSYDYSKYTYLNKQTISNAFVKGTGRATITANRAITNLNGVVQNVALNEAFFAMLEKYCDKGGTFALMTMWGYYSRFVLTELSIENTTPVGGVGWKFSFERFNTVNSGLAQTFSNTLSKLSTGAV